jgi:hypothetical protein
MAIALKAIEDGKKTRDEQNSALKDYYSQYQKGSEWSDTVVNTMRSGLFSRLNELGLMRREIWAKIYVIISLRKVKNISKTSQGKRRLKKNLCKRERRDECS